MKSILLSISMCFGLLVRAQLGNLNQTSAYTRLSAYSAVQTDVFAMEANQAALASLQNFSAGVYGEKKFLLNELAAYRVAVAAPFAAGRFGVNAHYTGSSLFNETRIGLAYARRMGKIDAGAQFNYHSFGIAGYGKLSTVNMEAAAIFHLTDKVHTGFQFSNGSSISIGKQTDERLPFTFSAGLGYDASEKVFAAAEISKTEERPVIMNAGIQYRFLQTILARAGISTAASSMYFGCGFLWNDLRLDATISWHQQLGLTPGILIIFHPEKK